MKHSKYFRFIVVLLTIGILVGIIMYLNLDSNSKKSIIEYFMNIQNNLANTKQNNLIFHLIIILLFILSSLTVVLYPLTTFYLFYELVSIGFTIASYFHLNGLFGVIYSLVYIIINKLLFIIILIYINYISYKMIKKIINSLLKKENIGIRELYLNYFSKILICLVALLIFNTLTYFFGNKILSLFKFLL